MATIYVRSPYKIGATGTANQAVTIELRVYNNPAAIPTSPTHVLSNNIPSALVTSIWFDIAPYIRDYIDHIAPTESATIGTILNSEYAKVQVKVLVDDSLISTTSYVCMDGFGYESEGYNLTKSFALPYLTEGEYQVSETTCGSIYFDTINDGLTYDFKYYNINTLASFGALSGAGSVLKAPYVHPSAFAAGGNILQIYQGLTLKAQYIFRTKCPAKYTTLNCDFVNRWGVWQRLTLFGANRISLASKSSEYRFMNRAANYNPAIGVRQEVNVNADRTIKTNTGFVDDFYADVIQQLMLSETILIDGSPVRLKNKSNELPNNINTKQINYALEFEYSNPLINTGA